MSDGGQEAMLLLAELEKKVTCPHCKRLLRDPYKPSCCLHRMCRVCIDERLNNVKTLNCPKCRIPLGPLKEARQDFIMAKIVAALVKTTEGAAGYLRALEEGEAGPSPKSRKRSLGDSPNPAPTHETQLEVIEAGSRGGDMGPDSAEQSGAESSDDEIVLNVPSSHPQHQESQDQDFEMDLAAAQAHSNASRDTDGPSSSTKARKARHDDEEEEEEEETPADATPTATASRSAKKKGPSRRAKAPAKASAKGKETVATAPARTTRAARHKDSSRASEVISLLTSDEEEEEEEGEGEEEDDEREEEAEGKEEEEEKERGEEEEEEEEEEVEGVDDNEENWESWHDPLAAMASPRFPPHSPLPSPMETPMEVVAQEESQELSSSPNEEPIHAPSSSPMEDAMVEQEGTQSPMEEPMMVVQEEESQDLFGGIQGRVPPTSTVRPGATVSAPPSPPQDHLDEEKQQDDHEEDHQREEEEEEADDDDDDDDHQKEEAEEEEDEELFASVGRLDRPLSMSPRRATSASSHTASSFSSMSSRSEWETCYDGQARREPEVQADGPTLAEPTIAEPAIGEPVGEGSSSREEDDVQAVSPRGSPLASDGAPDQNECVESDGDVTAEPETVAQLDWRATTTSGPSPLLPSPAVPSSYPPASPPLLSQPLSQPPSPLLSTKRHIDGSPKAPPPPLPPSSTPSVSAWPPSSATTSSKGPAKWLSQPAAKGSQSAPAANRKRVRSLGGGKGSQSSGRGSQSSGRGKPGPIQLEIGAFFVASQGQRKKEEEDEEDDFDLAELQSEGRREPRREDKGKARQLTGGMDAEEQEKRQTQGQEKEKEKGQAQGQQKDKGQEQKTPRQPPEWARQMKEASTHEKMGLSQGEEAREGGADVGRGDGAGESATWHGSPSQCHQKPGMAQQGPSGVGRDGESRQGGAAWEREGVDMRSPASRQTSWPPMSKPTPTKQSQEEGEEGEEEEGEEDMSMDLLGEEKQSFVLEEQEGGEEDGKEEEERGEGEREGEKECMPPPPPRTPGSATRRPLDHDHSQASNGGSGEDSQSPTQTGRVEEGGEAGEEQGQNQCESFGLGEGSAMSASQPGGGDAETDRGEGERPADVCLEGSSILVEATQETGIQGRIGLGRVVLDTQARPVEPEEEGLQEEVEGSSILVEPTQEGQLISGRSGLGRVVLDTQAVAVAPMGEEEMGGKGVLHDAPVLAEATQEGRRGGGGVVLDTQAVAPYSQSQAGQGESETAEGREGVEGSSILVEATQEGQAVGRRSGMGRVVLDTQAVAAAACEEETESSPLLQRQEEGAMDGPMDEAASEEATEGRSEGGESEDLKSPAHTSLHHASPSHHTPGRQPLSDMPDTHQSQSDTPQPEPGIHRSPSDTPQPPSDIHRSQSDTPDILVPPTPDSGGFGLFNRGKHVGPGRVVLGTQEMEAMQPDASLREDQQGEEERGEEEMGQWGMQASLPMLEGQAESCVREGQGSSSNPEESFVEVPPTPLDGPPVRRGGGIVRDTQAVQREEEEGEEGQGETAASLVIAMSPSREEGGEEDEERSQVIEMTMGEEKEEEEEEEHEGPGEARQGHRGEESGGSSTTVGHSRSDDSEGAEGQAEEETATMDGPCGPMPPPPEMEGATCPQSPLSNREAEGEGAGETMSQGALSQEGLNQGVLSQGGLSPEKLSQGTVVEEDRPASPPPVPHPNTDPPPGTTSAHPFSPPLPPARRASENSPTDGPPAASPNGTSGGGSLTHGSLIGSSLMGGASFLGSLFSQPSLAPGLTADSPSRSQLSQACREAMAGLHTAGRLVTHLSTTQQDALQHALHTHGVQGPSAAPDPPASINRDPAPSHSTEEDHDHTSGSMESQGPRGVVLVCPHMPQRQWMEEQIRQWHGWATTHTFTDDTTHVLLPCAPGELDHGGLRVLTPLFLEAMCRGLPVLDAQWVVNSASESICLEPHEAAPQHTEDYLVCWERDVDGVGMARAMSRPRATESQAIDNVLEGHVVALVGDPQDGGDTGFTLGDLSRLVALAGARLHDPEVNDNSNGDGNGDRRIAVVCSEGEGVEERLPGWCREGWRVVGLRWLLESIAAYEARDPFDYEPFGQTQF